MRPSSGGLNLGWVISPPFSNQTHWKVNIADGSARKDVTGGFIADGKWYHLAAPHRPSLGPGRNFTSGGCPASASNEASHHPESVEIAPNPNNGSFEARLEAMPDETESARFELYDSNGRLVSKWPLQGLNTQIDISDKPAGQYFLLLRSIAIAFRFQVEDAPVERFFRYFGAHLFQPGEQLALGQDFFVLKGIGNDVGYVSAHWLD